MANLRYTPYPWGPISVYSEQIRQNPQANTVAYGAGISDDYTLNSIPNGYMPTRTGTFQNGNFAPYTTSQPVLANWDEHQRGKQGEAHDTNAAIYQV